MKQTLLLGWLVLAGATVGTARPDAPGPPSLVPAAEARVAAPADTLQRRVTAGDDLIVTLPATLSDRPVASYVLLQAPAMSWLVDRSLLWRTRPNDIGPHTLLVEATFGDMTADTLAIHVDVTD